VLAAINNSTVAIRRSQAVSRRCERARHHARGGTNHAGRVSSGTLNISTCVEEAVFTISKRCQGIVHQGIDQQPFRLVKSRSLEDVPEFSRRVTGCRLQTSARPHSPSYLNLISGNEQRAAHRHSRQRASEIRATVSLSKVETNHTDSDQLATSWRRCRRELRPHSY